MVILAKTWCHDTYSQQMQFMQVEKYAVRKGRSSNFIKITKIDQFPSPW